MPFFEYSVLWGSAKIRYENYIFLIGMQHTKRVMGLLMGLAGDIQIIKRSKNVLFRGALLGLIVSSAIFLSTEFRDIPIFRWDSLWHYYRLRHSEIWKKYMI